jgi:hypothetical protein
MAAGVCRSPMLSRRCLAVGSRPFSSARPRSVTVTYPSLCPLGHHSGGCTWSPCRQRSQPGLVEAFSTSRSVPRSAERWDDRRVTRSATSRRALAAAHRLGLPHSTVKHHLANARSKVGAETTAQLVWILAPRLPEPEGTKSRPGTQGDAGRPAARGPSAIPTEAGVRRWASPSGSVRAVPDRDTPGGR